MRRLAGYGGLKEYLWVIFAILYVLGMFPLFYVYQAFPADRYTLVPEVAYISTGACVLLFAQFFVAALTVPKSAKKTESSS
jgi:hypothetical protein